MSIQQNIASDYYAMANHAQTPEQINAVRQHIAQTIQNGGLEAYKGIPILNELNGKLQSLQSADQMKAGLLPQKPPIAQQVLAQAQQTPQPQGIAQLQQPAQPEPMPTEEKSSGVDELPSRLPTEMAEGGIVGYANGGSVKHFQVGGLGIADLLPGFSPEELGALDQERDVEARRNVNRASGAKIPSIENIRAKPPIPNINALGARAPVNYPGISSTPITPAVQASEVTSPAQRIASAFRNSELLSNLFGKPTLATAAVPAAIAAGGYELGKGTMGTMAGNPYFEGYSDPGNGDAAVGNAILNATKDNPATPTTPANVQPNKKEVKEIKEAKKLNNAPLATIKKEVADNIVKEEVGPSKDLMTAEPTTPKEDILSKYEQMFTQAPEARQKEKDLDFYTRLFQAGIGVASGGSRNALENLKEAQPAIAGFASDIAKQREEDRNRIKDLASLGLKREEFGMELKKLGLTEKQINAVSKHYDDWNRHMKAQEGIENKKIGVMASANQDAKLTSNVNNVFTTLMNFHKNDIDKGAIDPMELYRQAQKYVGSTTGKTIGAGASTDASNRIFNFGNLK